MRQVGFIFAYYDNPTMLRHQFEAVRRYADELKQHIEMTVVDDGSPRWRAEAPATAVGCKVRMFRLTEDIRWNQDACRNLAVAHTKTEWLLLTDCDHLVPEKTMRAVMTMPVAPRTVYQFSRSTIVSVPNVEPMVKTPYHFHPNSWFMRRDLYEQIGGYDERFAGLYGTDSDFRERIAKAATVVRLKAEIIRVPREVVPDASTTTYQRKAPGDAPGIKRVKDERGGKPPLRGRFAWERVC